MSTHGLTGRVALVTGASKRVGRAIALELGVRGADVLVHYRSDAGEAESLAAELRALGRRAEISRADLTDAGAPAKLVAAALVVFGRLDIVVNSAGPFDRVPFVGGDDAAWEAAWKRSLDLTVMAPARLARAAATALGAHAEAGPTGVIVNILDIAAWQAWPSYAHHGAAKAALAHLTRTLAVALAPSVRVVGVAPGIVEWPETMDDATRTRLLARVPLARPGHGGDVARAVADLCASDYITGTTLVVDGGRLAATGEGG